ncbi:uncharacterized protein BX663DRAFT_507996 [Cokeromyces recurvatus]|uniref:uncharacterized protein n=1 Tax=Cokeromyces recurvatus TaxID=90255 RepID=UPI00221EED59|nr:uncharacterized protein BX663DRAFT_507996 [Cokeromyces recurvatus]KAI7903255.1 hypothetical protein BX663DRAFT_507996 [Cokeromyces recurvatus]
MTGRKVLTVPERHTQSHVSFVQGCKGAAMGAGLGLVATLLSFRFSPAFRALSRPYQYSMLASGGFTGYMFGSERAAFNFKNKTLGYVDHRTMDSRAYENYKALTFEPRERSLRFLNNHRWAILGTTWASTMAGAYGYSLYLTKLSSLKQRFFHARIYAQFATLLVLLASAGLSYYVDKNDKLLFKDMSESKLRAILELPVPEKNKQHVA